MMQWGNREGVSDEDRPTTGKLSDVQLLQAEMTRQNLELKRVIMSSTLWIISAVIASVGLAVAAVKVIF